MKFKFTQVCQSGSALAIQRVVITTPSGGYDGAGNSAKWLAV